MSRKRKYPDEIIISACEDYLSGGGSQSAIAAKYNLRSKTQLQKWTLLYNANRKLRDYNPKREVYMAEARRKSILLQNQRKQQKIDCLETFMPLLQIKNGQQM